MIYFNFSSHLGVITKLVMLRAKNQALLQMQDIPSAINAMQFYTNVQPTIRGRNVYVQFSSHQELTTMDQNAQGRGDEVSRLASYHIPNRILLSHPSYALSYYSGSATPGFLTSWICGEDRHISEVGWSASNFLSLLNSYNILSCLLNSCTIYLCFQALIQYQGRQNAISARTSLQGRKFMMAAASLIYSFQVGLFIHLDELQVHYNNERSRTEGQIITASGYGDAGVGFPQVGIAQFMV
ncbi:polypyrimidine tract-binding protein-like protein 3 [Gossypium australe]|uniref:Polypyrimidine tract-binding protein-like protein 3 n=1 Tax=Gossypium australe TaxID=47621 RepID=A0A5B6UF47_9ROSI|nr:polypyrimidine tract-binding protein-like protein 3 [Gossypium australe]